MSDSGAGEGDTETFAVGRDCEAWCGRCKETTYHTVVAMVEGKPKRVACRRCDDWHGYSRPRPVGAGAQTDKAAPHERSTTTTATTTRTRPRRDRVAEPPEAGGTTARPRRERAGNGRDSVSGTQMRWRAALDAAIGEPKAHDYRASYVVGDVVQHQSLGLCVVVRIESSRRAVVLCQDGERALLTPGARK